MESCETSVISLKPVSSSFSASRKIDAGGRDLNLPLIFGQPVGAPWQWNEFKGFMDGTITGFAERILALAGNAKPWIEFSFNVLQGEN